MSQGSNDSLDKGQQEAMLAHMIRCPRFYPLVHSGRINQEDFDWIYLRAAFQCLVGVMMIQGPDHPVGTMALMDQFKLVRRASNLNPVEEQQVLQFVVYTFSLQTSEAYYWAQLENYLGTMRTLHEVRKLKSSEWRLAADKIGAVASRSKINAGAICHPLMNYDITVAPETVPTGIRSIDRRLAGGGLGLKEYGILCAYTGVGKCLGKGTKVLKFDGSIVSVEDVRIGDLLMGPDSLPRHVKSICRGREEMFEVSQRNGDTFTCNRSHILSLKRTGHCQVSSGPTARSINRKGEIVNISVDEYLKQKSWFKHFYKAWKAPVEFSEKTLPLDPYIFGVWLGDGTSAETHVTTADKEIEKAVRDYATHNRMMVRVVLQQRTLCKTLCLSRKGDNPMLAALRGLGVMDNKHIPQVYLTSSGAQRMQLLAGLIDTDGYCPKRSVAVFTSTRKGLAEGVLFLARSLGFMCSMKSKKTSLKSGNYAGMAYNVTICGDVHDIPTKLKRRRPEGDVQRKQRVNAFSLRSIGEGDYYGFTLEGDGLFLLGDFTVTHNTTLALNFAWGAAKNRKKACFATLELDESKIRERLYSLIGRYDYNAIRYGRGAEQSREECWEEAVARVQAYGSEYASYLSVWDFSTEVCSISTLEDNLRREIAEDPHNPPKMLVVDWLLCLDEDMTKFDPKAMRDKEMRHKLQRYSDELSKRIARKYQVAVWATHQADAKAENVEVVTTKHSAEGKSAAWKCSVYLGVGTTLEQREKGIFTVTASKTRDGQTFTTKIHGALDQQRFESNDEEGSADPSMMIEGISLQDRIRHRDAAAAAAAEPEQPAEAELTPPPPPL